MPTSVLSAAPTPTAPGVFAVVDPATGEVLAEVPDGGAAEATAAVDAAHATASTWRATTPRERAGVLMRTHEAMLRDADRLAALLMAENGKPEADARAEVTYAAEFLHWYAEEAVRGEGQWTEAPAGGSRSLVTHSPVGVVAVVTPWNFPAAMITRKIAPALAAGCTVVVKPAEETPLTALALLELLTEAGLPEGVVSLVPTTAAAEVVTTWLGDPRVRALSFTGSTRVGRLLLRQAADRVVVPSMELGGNAPFVVTAGADVEAAVRGAMVAKFRNGGQACTAADRFLVHRDVHDAFVDGLAAAVAALRVGPASTPGGVDVGPMITTAQASRIRALVDDAVDRGARVVASAALPERAGDAFVAPTVLVDVPRDCAVVTEEVFGPVAAVVAYDDADDVVALANASESGLASYVFDRDLQRALRLGEALEAGMVGVNRGVVSDPSAPFGGVKQSGLGREGAREGIREFTETKFLSIDWS